MINRKRSEPVHSLMDRIWRMLILAALTAGSFQIIPAAPARAAVQRARSGAPTQPGDWPMAGANPQRTSRNASEVNGDLKPVWFHHFDAYISQKVEVIAAYNTLYISAADGLHALDAASGQEKWHFSTSLPLGNAPTIYEGVAYVGGMDGTLYALDASSGSLLWSFQASAGFETNPLVADGLVMAGNRNGVFYALYATGGQTGQPAWTFQTGGPILFSAAYQDGKVYFAANDNYAYALDAASGRLIWKSDQLPGHGFHSWWPVVGGSRVIFPGSYNYRYLEPFPGPHTILDTAEAFPDGLDKGDPIGPLGAAPGPWPAGTTTMDAGQIARYLEANPHRRTLFVLDGSTGKEFTFDSDGDGQPEYAPFLWFGTHSGTRYPPVIGADGLIYAPNGLYYDPWIPRGRFAAWSPDQPTTIALPSGYGGAVDEPVAASLGGNTLYWQRCCDRTAGAFQYAGAAAANLQQWGYFDEGGRPLRRFLPELFAKGWPFAYWKHGDPTPPIPFNGMIYTIANNAVVAFGPNGGDPVLPGDFIPGDYTGYQAEDIEREQTAAGLNQFLTAGSSQWPLLIQQESFYSTSDRTSARGRFFPLFEVTASGGQPSGLNVEQDDLAAKFTTSFSGGTLESWISQRAPGTLFHTDSSHYQLNGNLQGIAVPTAGGIQVHTSPATIAGSDLNAGWILAWDGTSSHRWSPVVISFEHRPLQVEFTTGWLNLPFSGAAGYLTVTPLNGLSAPLSEEANRWASGGIPSATAAKVTTLDRMARAFPSTVNETMEIDPASGDANLRFTYGFIQFSGDWGTPPLKMGYLPPEYALGAWNGSPIRVNGQGLETQLDLQYVTPLGRLAGVANSGSVTLTLPGIARFWRDNWDPAASPPDPNDPAFIQLVAQVQAVLNAGHLRPAYGLVGIWESRGANRIGDDLADYFHNPADTQLALLRALPWLPDTMQTAVRNYLQAEFTAYPLYNTAHTGWNRGAAREAFRLPPEVEAAAGSIGKQDSTNFNGWGLPPINLYSLYRYAAVFGDAGTLLAEAQSKLDNDPSFDTSFPYTLNSQIAGHIGYMKLAQLAGRPDQPEAERALIHLLLLRAALSKYPDALKQTGFEYSGRAWTLRRYAPDQVDTLFSATVAGSLWSQLPLYGFPKEMLYGLSGSPLGGDYTFMTDFYPLTFESAAFLRSYAYKEVQAATNSYARRAPYWFVAQAEETGGEGVFQPLYDRIAYFQARALVVAQSRPELDPYIDVAAYQTGDMFFIQNLVTLLEAEGDPIQPPPPIPTPPAPDPVRINFQPGGSPAPNGFLADDGSPFGDRGNGYSYGWDEDNRQNARDRNASNSPDEMHDTFNHLQYGREYSWEIALPAGSYEVTLAAGDAEHFDSNYQIEVEGTLALSGSPTDEARWVSGSTFVTVADGRLTIRSAAGASNNKIDFIEIIPVGGPAWTNLKYRMYLPQISKGSP